MAFLLSYEKEKDLDPFFKILLFYSLVP